jgi:hypothetical protein
LATPFWDLYSPPLPDPRAWPGLSLLFALYTFLVVLGRLQPRPTHGTSLLNSLCSKWAHYFFLWNLLQ